MQLYKAKKVIIVTEATVLNVISKLATELGTSSYTVSRASGKGASGSRLVDDISGVLSNVKIEIITNEEIAHKLVVALVNRYFQHYAGIVYLQDVEVVQPEKFNLAEQNVSEKGRHTGS